MLGILASELPGFFSMSVAALPALLGLLNAARHIRTGARSLYVRNLVGSTVSASAALFTMWDWLFSDALMRSSTAGIIFVLAPIYAAFAQGLGYVLSMLVTRRSRDPRPVSGVGRVVMALPAAVLAALLGGLFNLWLPDFNSAVAEKSSNIATLRRFYERSQQDDPYARRLAAALGSNLNTPPEILTALAMHQRGDVREAVAGNRQTPRDVLLALSVDCSRFVRGAAWERLGLDPLQTSALLSRCGSDSFGAEDLRGYTREVPAQ